MVRKKPVRVHGPDVVQVSAWLEQDIAQAYRTAKNFFYPKHLLNGGVYLLLRRLGMIEESPVWETVVSGMAGAAKGAPQDASVVAMVKEHNEILRQGREQYLAAGVRVKIRSLLPALAWRQLTMTLPLRLWEAMDQAWLGKYLGKGDIASIGAYRMLLAEGFIEPIPECEKMYELMKTVVPHLKQGREA